MTINIEGHAIGTGYPPFVIAEMSGNHNHSLQRALQIVDAAAAAGVNAMKLQTYTPDTMTLDLTGGDFSVDDAGSPWNHKSLYELYSEAAIPWEWHEIIFSRCREQGVVGFSTPFDETAVDFLEQLNVPAYKIASFENTDLSLIRKVASTGKPLIISSGLATAAELDESVRTARSAGATDIVVLKCTSTYPAPSSQTNLLTIPHMKALLQTEVGLSDHTLGIGVSVAAVALGAAVIEKHFTLARADGGTDAAFSLEPPELRQLVAESTSAWKALGEVTYGPTAAEEKSLQFRRSLFITKDIQSGEIFTEAHIRSLRPGFGLPPKYRHLFIGKTAHRDYTRGTPVSWNMLSGE